MPNLVTEAVAPSEQPIVPDASHIPVPPRTSATTSAPPADAAIAGEIEGGKEGEGGEAATSFTPFTPSNAAFLDTIFAELPPGAQPAVLAKPGDPENGGWYPVDAANVEQFSANTNTYFNCSSLFPTDGGELAARKELAAAYHALVLDDVGTKVDRSLLGDFLPTWELETSPGNFQIGFRISPPLQSAESVESLQKRISLAGLTDTGALGMVRWARLPNGINGKPKHAIDGKPFPCRLHAWNPIVSYTADEIVAALAPQQSSTPASPRRRSPESKSAHGIGDRVYTARADENPVLAALREQGYYKREISAGKHEVTCPWFEEHTDSLDTGAAYFEPVPNSPSEAFAASTRTKMTTTSPSFWSVSMSRRRRQGKGLLSIS